jgi:multidrug resistance efflux pump
MFRLHVRPAFLVLLIFFFVLATACSQVPIRKQYKALNLAADVRSIILTEAADAKVNGLIDKVTWDRIAAADKYVQQAGLMATAALKQLQYYEALQKAAGAEAVDQAELDRALNEYDAAKAELKSRWREFLKIVEPWYQTWIEKYTRENPG